MYCDYVVKKLNNRTVFENPTSDVLREDEVEYVKMMIGKRIREANSNQDVAKICGPLI